MIDYLKKNVNSKNPLFRFFLFLSFFSLIATFDLLLPTTDQAQKIDYIIRLFVTFISTIFIWRFLLHRFEYKTLNPWNFFISAWIIFLLVHPTNQLLYFPLVVLCIALGKYLFRVNKRPVFNPAAFAIFIAIIISLVIGWVRQSGDMIIISWWGADMSQNMIGHIPILNFIISAFFFLGFFYFAFIFKRAVYVVSFFAVFLLITFLSSVLSLTFEKAFEITGSMFFNSMAFFALVMLPEPKTSPVFTKEQVLIGIISAVILFLLNTYFGFLPVDPMILSILFANLMVFAVLKYRGKKS